MKTKCLLKLMLLLCALLVGSVSSWADTVNDVLNQTFTGVTGTIYSDFSGKSGTSGAVYAGQCAGGNSSIQLRSNNNNSGIVTTTSGGKAKKIAVDWNSNTTSGRTLNVYGKNTAYSDATDLYNTNNQGTFIGTIVCGTSTELEIDNDYEFIGFRSASGAMYLTSVTITWETSGGSTTESCVAPTFSPAAGTYTSAQNVTISTTTEGATIYYTTDGTDPTTSSSLYSSAISVNQATTIKAIAVKQDFNDSEVSTATYTFVSIEHAGTEADPYTVADARNAIDANFGVDNVYATGIVSKIVQTYDSQYSNITFNISTDGLTTSDQLQAFRCVSTDAADASKVQVGDVVVIKGDLKKYNNTYEFAQANELVSLQHSANPIITATPTSLADFTYAVDNGPSAVKTISVSGSNLTTDVNLSLGENSNFEISLSEGSGYASNLTITAGETSGNLASTTVYVRLKAGLTINASYEGTITLSSTGANDVTVSLAGSVTEPEAPNVTWDLSTDQTATATEDEMTWTSNYATMKVEKGSASTPTNNYYPGTPNQNYTSTRFYKSSELSITPVTGFKITSVVFEATTQGYANALKNSTWTNASAAVDNMTMTTVTVTPTDGTKAISATIGGTCGFTSVKVFYEVPAPFAPVWSALPTPTVTLGEGYSLSLTQYVSGYPVPEITLTSGGDIATFASEKDNTFSFNPTTAGTFEFVFTATNSEGSSNAKLTITAVKPAATITVSENNIEVSSEKTSGTIEVTYNNIKNIAPAVKFYEADGTTEATYNWISAEINSGYNVNYVITDNEGAARTAYMKVYSKDDDANDVYSELITITQAAPVVTTTYTLATSITPGMHYIIVGENNGSYKAMGEQKSSNRAAVYIDVDNGIASVASDAGVYEFVIFGPDADGRYAIYDETSTKEGYLYAASSSSNYLKTQDTNNINGKWKITFDEGVASIVADGSSNRNVMQYNSSSSLFACYASDSQSPVYLYEKDNNGTIVKRTVHITGAGYATYCAENALEFTGSGMTAYIATTSGSKVVFEPVTCVPANTGILLKGEEGDWNINVVASSGTDVTSNKFVGVTVETPDVPAGIFVLMNGNSGIGFYKTTAPFTVRANSAYLPADIVSGSDSRSFIGFDTTTGISTMQDAQNMMQNEVYNLNGQRVAAPQRGLYIVNGRKVMVK